MEKRYQVFVSSTYADLQDERQEVMQALLELDCIPSGMELFPAANEDQWSLIKKVIDDCDYYIVIVAGRYGSTGADGQSYTEMEYRYALEKGKPVIGFIHRDPSSLASKRCEQLPESKTKLADFSALVQKKMCRLWDSPSDLGSQVSRSLIKLIKSTPAVGWVRANLVPDGSAAEEMLRLRKRIDELELRLSAARLQAPEGTSTLSQGEELFDIGFQFSANTPGEFFDSGTYGYSIKLSWDDVFAAVSPLMIDESSEETIRVALNQLISNAARPILQKQESEALKGKSLTNFQVSEDHFQTIKVQLRALGLIGKSSKSRSVKDISTYWTLTPYGDTVMTRLRAIEREREAISKP